jgi:mannose-6-phosphate isomerase-like protein (cupin superfamily)
MSDSFDPAENYLLLEPDGSVVRLPGGEDFWNQLMSGNPRHAGIKQLLNSRTGRLLSVFHGDADWKNWEMHPAADEVLLLLKGAMTLVFEQGGEKLIELEQGQVAIVPKGVWHTARMSMPTTLLALTAGQGTQHRPV